MTEPHTEPLPIEVEAAAAWRGLVKNFGTLLLGEGAAAFFGLVTFLLLARNLGPAGFGLVSVGIALVGWLSLGVDSGTEILSLRNVSRDPAGFRELAERILGLRIVTSLTVAAVYLVIIGIGTRSPSNRAVYLGFAVALPAIALNLRWIVLGIGGARAVAVGNLAARIVFLCGVVLAVLARRLPERWFAIAMGFLALQLNLAVLGDLRTLLVISAFSSTHSDALLAASVSHVPSLIWAVLWTVISGMLLLWSSRQALGYNRPRRTPLTV